MKIVIPGGSGQVGQILARTFLNDGHDVVILSRHVAANWMGRPVLWDGRTLGAWTEELEAADVVINLAGKSVNCRYTARNRREIIRSREDSTAVIGQAIARAQRPPCLWLQAATATIYAHRYDAANDEASGILGGHEENVPATWNFSIDVAAAWERAFNNAPFSPHTRKVLLRSALTLSPDRGGVFDALLGLVRRGLGGRMGHGRQYVSWIQDGDFVRAIYWLIAHENLEGAVNLASPNPLPNADFMRILREAWGARVGLPAPKWLLEMATFFMRTETELVLKSRRVTPGRLLQSGFEFKFPDWNDAARDLCRRWRLT
ncbi:MAG: uncharacterized protein QOE34_1651 [Verrucomicrobiota bacterium]|jgi:uncharacterized protein (TIGR01777 family)